MDINHKLQAFNSKVFHAYDIRGRYPEDLDPNNVELIVRGFIKFLDKFPGKNVILVGGDVRWSSPEISKEVTKTLVACGAEVWDLGLSTTPQFTFSLAKSKAKGGIMITASHNPVEYNGLKLFEGFRAMSEDVGLKEIIRIVNSGKIAEDSAGGFLTKKDYRSEYVDFIASNARFKRKPKVVFDAAGGSVGAILPDILKKINLESDCLFLEKDSYLKNHLPNPLSKEAQIPAREKILETGAEAGFIFDVDGDRVVVLNEMGEEVRSDAVLWLLASRIAKRGDTVVFDLRSSRALREDLEELGIKSEKSRVGRTFMNTVMREHKALLGGELSGHFFFRDFFNSDSALFAAMKILEILSESKKKLSALVKTFFRYAHSGEINFKAKGKDQILKKLEEKYGAGERNYLDGLTVDFSNWWFNIRPSNTEDILRLVFEAENRKTFGEKEKELLGFLTDLGAERV